MGAVSCDVCLVVVSLTGKLTWWFLLVEFLEVTELTGPGSYVSSMPLTRF